MMRMDLVATNSAEQEGSLSLLLKTRGTHESFACETDITSLIVWLETESGLPYYAVELFFKRLKLANKAPLYGVRLSDATLQRLGFFLD